MLEMSLIHSLSCCCVSLSRPRQDRVPAEPRQPRDLPEGLRPDRALLRGGRRGQQPRPPGGPGQPAVPLPPAGGPHGGLPALNPAPFTPAPDPLHPSAKTHHVALSKNLPRGGGPFVAPPTLYAPNPPISRSFLFNQSQLAAAPSLPPSAPCRRKTRLSESDGPTLCSFISQSRSFV